MREHPKALYTDYVKIYRDEPMGNPQETYAISGPDIGWVAGIIDGEGSVSLAFSIRNGKIWGMSPRVEMANTDKELMEKFVRLVKGIGGGIYMTEKKSTQQTSLVRHIDGREYKGLYYAKAVGYKRTKKLLDVVLPHLTGEKRLRAELILKFTNCRLSKMVDYEGTGKSKKPLYDEEDYRIALEVCKTMRTKFTSIIEGILRDYTRPQKQTA